MIQTLIRTSALFALVGIAAFALRNRSAALRHMPDGGLGHREHPLAR